MLNCAHIDRTLLDYIIDLNHKHERYMWVERLPVFPPSKLLKDKRDYILILAGNFAKEIVR